MITRDFILRQIQQLVQVLAQVLMLRSTRQEETALQEIDRVLNETPGLGVLLNSDLTRDNVLATCGAGDEFIPDKALILADVLVEKADLLHVEEERKRYLRYALWLYEGSLTNADAAVPLDIHDRVTWIKEQFERE